MVIEGFIEKVIFKKMFVVDERVSFGDSWGRVYYVKKYKKFEVFEVGLC